MNDSKNITFAILLTIISVLAGVGLYKLYYKDLHEIYLTQSMVNQYAADNKGLFKKEVISIVVVLLCTIVFGFLFLVDNKTIWLIFSLFLLLLFVFGTCGIPIERFKLLQSIDK